MYKVTDGYLHTWGPFGQVVVKGIDFFHKCYFANLSNKFEINKVYTI